MTSGVCLLRPFCPPNINVTACFSLCRDGTIHSTMASLRIAHACDEWPLCSFSNFLLSMHADASTSSPSTSCARFGPSPSNKGLEIIRKNRRPQSCRLSCFELADGAQDLASAQAKEQKSSRKFNWKLADGGQIKAMIEKTGFCFKVKLDVTLMQKTEVMCLVWFLFQTASNTLTLNAEDIPDGTKRDGQTLQTPFDLLDSGMHSVEFELNSRYAPAFMSFSLYYLSKTNQKVWIRSKTNSSFCLPVGCGSGQPDLLGARVEVDGSAKFSLYSKRASNVILCLFKAGFTEPVMELELQSSVNHTGNIWHVELDDVSAYKSYGYRCGRKRILEEGNQSCLSHVLLDPYAKLLLDSPLKTPVLGLLRTDESDLDWEDDVHPNIPLETTVAYRLNVMGFTADKSSGLENGLRGTFDGIIEKIKYLNQLGVNTVILQPISAFTKKSSYYPISFFAPMPCFGPLDTGISSSLSFKRMVKALHQHNIEVIMDVVYTHTGEENEESHKIVSYGGIDKETYYVVDKSKSMRSSTSEVGNCLNCNHPVVQTLVLDSLRHWVTEYHVDGFCFANAASLTRGPHGEELSRPLLIEAISFDPILSRRKLFADTCFASYQVNEEFKFPHWKRWCVWNYKYRNDIRRFLRGDKGQLSSFATRFCGSGDVFADGRGPSFSLNYVTGPYGMTLVDLVSYSETPYAELELSWNCGQEGRTLNQLVLELRVKQVRNFMMCLFLSQGIPVLNMGDEYGITKGGSILIDKRKAFNWDALNLDFGRQLTYLISSLVAFRSRRSDLFQRKEFLKLENIRWYGPEADSPSWESEDSAFLAVSLKPESNGLNTETAGLGGIYVGFNSEDAPMLVYLPEAPAGFSWYRIADTSLPYPDFFVEHGVAIKATQGEARSSAVYEIQSYSSILLEARAQG